MLKTRGLFSYFPKLTNIEVAKVAFWLNCGNNPQILENKLGNRILYWQTIPITYDDLIFDLCLFREALKLQPQSFYNQNLKKIYIPEEFLEMFPNIQELAMAFVDSIGHLGISSIVTRFENVGVKNLGTLIKPEIFSESGSINIFVKGKSYQIKIGSLVIIPADSQKVDIKFESEVAKLLTKNSLIAEVVGGVLGVIVDTRKNIEPYKICPEKKF